MTTTLDNSQDIIDSRDVIARIEELESEIEAEMISEDNGATPQLDDDGNTIEEIATCNTCGKEWNDALITDRTPAPSARCPYEAIHEEIEELRVLKAFAEEAEEYAEDWQYGATLIRESYFVEYCEDLCKDIGDLPKDIPHYIEIDWEKTAENIKADYTEVEFDGVVYLVR